MTNPRGIYFDYIGNHVMAYLLSLSKRFPDFMDAQRKKIGIKKLMGIRQYTWMKQHYDSGSRRYRSRRGKTM
ncbi:MAG: hypothetical protein Ct9H90mP2_01900 [Dehalococcoidia bacterium]|nr:MAG: hypothetical protein Ct9H90mP2_01900 [Dehalococcoidia bacterium]